ncbi:MAG: DNA-deoxyinosine glycosylase [Gammaproteobacteria bacterium]|nr:DNA-deoxyinosine glycosylase [Gammaproteobacteria bacterium]
MNTPTTLFAFPPLAHTDASVLILGSMPGVASLSAAQYYAHPRNGFWPMMASLFAFDVLLPYEQRVALLLKNRIAVWDVLQSCARPGSLDANIIQSSIIANDFVSFFNAHPSIKTVYFNGQTAAKLYKRYVLPTVMTHTLHYQTLPSTSPAHASLSFADKLTVWQQLILPAKKN